MSRYFSPKLKSLSPYVPGEQPRERRYIKLNTNESPFPPSEKAQAYAAQAAGSLQLYCDPACGALTEAFCAVYGVGAQNVIFTNGSDEALNFCFIAFCDDDTPAVFPDITYGFYLVFAALNGVPYREIPLLGDLSADIDDYCGAGGTIFLANPNAPTGIALPLCDIERIVRENPDHVVVIDEAYVDFGGESAIGLTERYDNLLVIGTFSKSRSLAGGRLGFAVGNAALIADLNTVKFSTNPYNVNTVTQAMGCGVLGDEAYTRANCATIIENRAFISDALEQLGFRLTPSKANFIFAECHEIPGEELYRQLRERGVLVRHFSNPRIADYNRITVGTKEQMEILLENIKEILEEYHENR